MTVEGRSTLVDGLILGYIVL